MPQNQGGNGCLFEKADVKHYKNDIVSHVFSRTNGSLIVYSGDVADNAHILQVTPKVGNIQLLNKFHFSIRELPYVTYAQKGDQKMSQICGQTNRTEGSKTTQMLWASYILSGVYFWGRKFVKVALFIPPQCAFPLSV